MFPENADSQCSIAVVTLLTGHTQQLDRHHAGNKGKAIDKVN
ncbi:hypothetical protein [Aerosakkonema sp. BLCC-F183]